MVSESGKFKFINGFKWPAHDTHCAEVVFDSLKDLDRAISHTKNKRTVIQAGGNCGVWASHLAKIFSQVWTFEPDSDNYHCLSYNTMKYRNVFCSNSALGSNPGQVSLERERGNCGAHAVSTSHSRECIPLNVLDDYDPRIIGIVDLIYLDVEGYELHAVVGATQLIARCKPIIAVEDKGLSERYGVAKGDVLRYIRDTFNYEVIDEYGRDYVLGPRAGSAN
jgi:FkbM family methyltransferase